MNYTKVYSLNVEFEEVDSYRIAHHTKLIAYLERARVRFFDMIGVELSLDKYTMVLYGLDIKFQKPAFFLDKLDVYIALEKQSDVKLDLFYKIYRGKELLCRASTTLSFVENNSGIIPVPSEIKDKLDRYINGEYSE